jgi:hypothetical protein
VLVDLLNMSKLDAVLAKSAQAIEDSWTTVGLQRGMNQLVRDMSENFETVFRESEDIKKLMQGVYNTFIAKFAFQKMTIPALDLDPHRTKLQLLVMQTDAFVKDPVNVVVKEKHFVVKNFYATLVKEARRNFSRRQEPDRALAAGGDLPLEVQIKDHKAQLQSRLDNLSKINEKTTSINEQDGDREGGRGGSQAPARHDRGPDHAGLRPCRDRVARSGGAVRAARQGRAGGRARAEGRAGHAADHQARDLRGAEAPARAQAAGPARLGRPDGRAGQAQAPAPVAAQGGVAPAAHGDPPAAPRSEPDAALAEKDERTQRLDNEERTSASATRNAPSGSPSSSARSA